MDTETNFCLILSTCPNEENAQIIATDLVESGHAACVSIMPKLTSIYRWQDKIESSNEYMLLIKTMKSKLPQIEALIIATHPYELPEIISVPISGGFDQYLDWIADNVT